MLFRSVKAEGMLKACGPFEEKILDAGCGTGLTGTALKNTGYTRITGIDISANSLSLAHNTGAYERLAEQDLQRQPFPFKKGEFGGIICVGVLTYIEKPKALFEEFCRLVRPGGCIVFTHRDDLIKPYKYPEILLDLQERGCWKNLLTTEPKLYLPNNEDFADKVRVVYFLFRTAEA